MSQQVTNEEAKQILIKKLHLKHQRENILKSKSDLEEELAIHGKKFIYPNQQKAADEVIQAYRDGKIAVCLIAPPGVGKTGTGTAIMVEMATLENDDEIIEQENIINYTGMSDKDWERQYKKAMLRQFIENVFHRQNFAKNKDKLSTMKNGLVICDECHVASDSKMTIAKTLKDSALLDVGVLRLKNIKLLDISATPDSVLANYGKWPKDKYAVVKIEPGPSYKGLEHMLSDGRIIRAPDLDALKDYQELLEQMEDRYKNTTKKKYFIFRLLDSEKIATLKTLSKSIDWNCREHNSDDRIDNIDEILKTAPEKHEIIIIKRFWGASKRISCLTHIGATYESVPKTMNISSTAQSLPGRFCDNYEYKGEQENPDLRPLHYCDKEAIEYYVDWFNNDCNYEKVIYKSSRIRSNGKGNVRAKQSKVSTNFVTGLDSETESQSEIITKIFVSQDDAKEFYKNNLKPNLGKTRGPNKRRPNEQGFYEATIWREKKVWSVEEMETRPYIGSSNNGYWFYPCYKDTKDNTTLQWWLIYKKNLSVNQSNTTEDLYPNGEGGV